MGKRRQKATQRKRSSSADIRFTVVILGLGAVLVLLGSVLVGQIRAADWSGAAISGVIISALVAVGTYSGIQKRRG